MLVLSSLALGHLLLHLECPVLHWQLPGGDQLVFMLCPLLQDLCCVWRLFHFCKLPLGECSPVKAPRCIILEAEGRPARAAPQLLRRMLVGFNTSQDCFVSVPV